MMSNRKSRTELEQYKQPSKIAVTNITEAVPEFVEVGSLVRGDCFLRAGSLCMVVENMVVENSEIAKVQIGGYIPTHVAIINLSTGRVWPIQVTEPVKLVLEVKLTFKEWV